MANQTETCLVGIFSALLDCRIVKAEIVFECLFEDNPKIVNDVALIRLSLLRFLPSSSLRVPSNRL